MTGWYIVKNRCNDKERSLRLNIIVFIGFVALQSRFVYMPLKNSLNRIVSCYMNIWGVAVLELDSHPGNNKGPDHAPCAGPYTHPLDH